MTFIIEDRVRETTTTTGTGAFSLAGAVPGHRAFSAVLSNLDTTWYTCVLPGGEWEIGLGTWVTGNSLQRTSLLRSSTGAAISFSAGTKDIFIGLPASKANAQNNSFAPGTLLTFQQTSAPTYWTKQVTHNDKALRVVSGTAGSGGANAFSAALNTSNSVGNTTISITTMASHGHSYTAPNNPLPVQGGGTYPSTNVGSGGSTTGSTGGDGAHNHTYNINVQYVDLIIASKDA